MDILSIVLIFLPLGIVLWLANLSWRKRIEGDLKSERLLKFLAYGLLALLFGGLILLGGLFQIGGLLLPMAPNADEILGDTGFDVGMLSRMGLALWLPSVLGLLMLLRAPRRLAARFTGIDPANPVHAVALAMSSLVLVSLLSTLAMGLGNLASMLEASREAGIEANITPVLWAQAISFVLIAFVGVGWLATRTLRGAVNRLGLTLPTVGQAVLGVGTGLLMVPVVIALEYAAARIGLGSAPDVERLSEQLIGPLTMTIPGILTLGLAAALGEESVFRGALQPRFGLVFTSLLFALLHSQYGVSFATVAVFGVGLILGLLRQRANTTTAMIAHAVYNMSLGLIAYFGWLQNL